MNYKISIALIVLAFLLSGNQVWSQSAWTQPKGEGFFKLQQSGIVAGDFFNLEGEIIDITTTSVFTSSIYGEYGLSDRLTAVAYLPLFVRSTLNKRESTIDGVTIPGDELNGLGDPLIGIKYNILPKGPIRLAVDALVGIPLGKNVGGDTELLQTGDGEFNQQIRLLASRSFGKTYVTLLTGYNHRTKADFEYSTGTLEDVDFSDEFHWGGEVGWLPSEQWLLLLKVYQIIPLGQKSGPATMSNSLFGNNVGYFSMTPEINYLLNDQFGASLSIGGALSGQNILAAPNIGLGLFYRLRK